MAYIMSKKTALLIFGLATSISLLLKPYSDTTQNPPALFTPVKVGAQTLQHRVVLAPLTRYRSTQKAHVPITPMMTTYYGQRARRPGSLLVTEATFIAPHAGGYDHVPGIWSVPQIAAWKEVRFQRLVHHHRDKGTLIRGQCRSRTPCTRRARSSSFNFGR